MPPEEFNVVREYVREQVKGLLQELGVEVQA